MTIKTVKKVTAMIVVVTTMMFFIVVALSCNSPLLEFNPIENEPRVYIEENDIQFSVVGSNLISADEDGNAVVNLNMKGKFFVCGVSNPIYEVDAEIVKDGGLDGDARIIIKNITFFVRITIECDFSGVNIIYNSNGGELIADDYDAEEFAVSYSLKNHFRPNTEIGTNKIVREGYVLSGWNTLADGTGEHIGLGSRITAIEGEELRVYAEWSKWTDISNFTYRDVFAAGFSILSYKGNQNIITVPEFIGGKRVEIIAEGAFNGATADKIILPKGLKKVASGAFVNCKFKELYLYDDIEIISDDSFVSCSEFSTLFINAIEPPRFVTQDRHSNLADKYDILILNKDVKKLIVFGGSGTFFSIDTNLIEEDFSDYVCINMGVNGWFNAVAQFEMIMAYLKQDDVFIHVPEAASASQLMYDIGMYSNVGNGEYDNRFFSTLELNYDLLSLVDIRNITDVFDGFTLFNDVRSQYSGQSYGDYISYVEYSGGIFLTDTGYIDDRGNYAPPLPPVGAKGALGEANIVSGYVRDVGAHTRLNYYYDKLRDEGVKPFFINAAVNKDILLKRIIEPTYANFATFPHPQDFPLSTSNYNYFINEFDEVVDEFLNIQNILGLNSCLYPTEDFGGSDYHLGDPAIVIHTNKIVNALKAYLI